MKTKYESGLYFEHEAEVYFIHKMKVLGARANLIKQRYRYKGGEIDLIYKVEGHDKYSGYHFLEVRGKSEGSWTLDPLLSISQKKLYRIKRGVNVFISQHKIKNETIHLGFLYYQNKGWTHLSDLVFF